MNGGKGALPMEFILTIQNGSRPMRIVLSQVALLTSWRRGCAKLMEVIVGFWLGTTRCAKTKVRSCDGMFACTDIEDRKQAEDTLHRENVALREEIDKASMFEEIVGTSPALQTVLSRISKVAPSNSTVLITGETGTGKELVARAIHRRSDRSSRAFISVNCAAIPRETDRLGVVRAREGCLYGRDSAALG
jgi:ABC-type multidrug transport system fused ATPase/permease subunit